MLTPRQIRNHYRRYQKTADVDKSPLKPKIDKLYEELNRIEEKNGDSLGDRLRQLFHQQPPCSEDNRKNLILWTLSYFFESSDLISDDVPVYGRLDDMLVIDTALEILSRNKESE